MGNQIKQKKCYIYMRVSTEMQIDGYSLEAQRERLLKEAEHRDMKVVGEFSDEGKSGKNIKGRPEFQRMMNCIEQRADDVDYVLVFKLSRFGRNTADTLNSLQLMQDYGVNLLCVDDGIDSAGASGKLMISVLAAVAEIERENIQAQTMAGRWQKARDGRWNGGFAPYGYELIDGELVIQEDEAVAVRLIFDKYTNGNMGINAVAKWLNDNGYKKIVRKNGTLDMFSAHLVKLVLDNPVYAGYISYGRRKNEKIDGTRNEYHVVKQDSFEVFEGRHEAIIDRDLWERTKAKREINAFTREKRFSPDHAHVLSGIVKCPKCGAPMYGAVNRKKKKGKDEYYTDMWYYICKNRKSVSGHSCDYKTHIRQDIVDEQVTAIIKEALADADFTSDIFKKIGTESNLDELKKDLVRLKKVRSKEDTKKSKLLAKIKALDPSDDLYDVLYDDLQGVLREIAENIANYDESIYKTELAIENATGKQVTAEKVYSIMAAMIEFLDIMPDEDKRILMNYLLDSVQLHEKRQDNGCWVKSIRFKVALNLDGQLCDQIDIGTMSSLPNENHDETVCLLSKLNVEHHIEVEINLDEMDLMAAESKATCE